MNTESRISNPSKETLSTENLKRFNKCVEDLLKQGDIVKGNKAYGELAVFTGKLKDGWVKIQQESEKGVIGRLIVDVASGNMRYYYKNQTGYEPVETFKKGHVTEEEKSNGRSAFWFSPPTEPARSLDLITVNEKLRSAKIDKNLMQRGIRNIKAFSRRFHTPKRTKTT